MNIAIITIAGVSSRFNEGVDESVRQLKAIYYEENPHNTLLYHLIKKVEGMDKIILVTGYRHDSVLGYIEKYLPEALKKKIELIYNEHYGDWSSGYSLSLGIKRAVKEKPLSILFAEGDLDIDEPSFRKIASSTKDVISYNHQLIQSDKAVVAYQNAEHKVRYVYNKSHGLLTIEEPFTTLFNSGQIWKFFDIDLLELAEKEFEKLKESGTNLEIIGRYFQEKGADEVDLIEINEWVNCNTRDDYREILKKWRKGHEIIE